MAKIAVGSEAPPRARTLASGAGWTVSDVVCTAGPQHRPFEEQHARTSIAIVLRGTFQYRTSSGRELMTPGSLLLGNAGDCFLCGHEYGAGDRCLSFSYAPEFGAGMARPRFQTPRLPPIRALAPLVCRAAGLLAQPDPAAFEELAVQVLAQAIQIERGGMPRPAAAAPGSLARVTRVVRMIDHDPDIPWDLAGLARVARLSPYHFLRTFQALTGTTPHQYLLRMRLRSAAVRLRAESTKIVDIAFASGFGDVSNFNRTFRAEFGVTPRAYRSRPW